MNRPSSIERLILEEGGRVTLARFMELALTHPRLGYYSQVENLLGRRGDFDTAPALSPFFCRTLARLVTEMVDAALAFGLVPPGQSAAVIELGGGEGHLAQAVLSYWHENRPGWRGRVAYRFVEIGPGLRQRQQEAIGSAVAAGWQVGWGSDLAEACQGVVPVTMVGNEFLDALPVHLLDANQGEIREAYVEVGVPQASSPAGHAHSLGQAGLTLTESWGPPSDAALSELELLFGPGPAERAESGHLDPHNLSAFTTDGMLEIRPAVGDFLQEAAKIMPTGTLILVDYGEWCPVGPQPDSQPCRPAPSPPSEFAAPALKRRRRTLRGYFKNQLVTEILAHPGRQDLTADVDFAAFGLHARRLGFQCVVFTNLGAFLRAGGAGEELLRLHQVQAQAERDALEADREATVLAALLDERDLGSAFKLLVLAREQTGEGSYQTDDQ